MTVTVVCDIRVFRWNTRHLLEAHAVFFLYLHVFLQCFWMHTRARGCSFRVNSHWRLDRNPFLRTRIAEGLLGFRVECSTLYMKMSLARHTWFSSSNMRGFSAIRFRTLRHVVICICPLISFIQGLDQPFQVRTWCKFLCQYDNSWNSQCINLNLPASFYEA